MSQNGHQSYLLALFKIFCRHQFMLYSSSGDQFVCCLNALANPLFNLTISVTNLLNELFFLANCPFTKMAH